MTSMCRMLLFLASPCTHSVSLVLLAAQVLP